MNISFSSSRSSAAICAEDSSRQPSRHNDRVPTVDVERYLEAVVKTARDVLGLGFVGAYAAGSIALDAFQPDRSDIDIAVVCRSPLNQSTKRALIAQLRHRALPCPARGLELVVYTRTAAQSGTAEPGLELDLNDGPAMGFRQSFEPANRPAADGAFWYGIDRSILHQSGRSLAGPPASKTFSDLPPEELRALLIDSLHWWTARSNQSGRESEVGTEEAVLGACRALVRHRDGRWLSKAAAGRRLLSTGYQPAETIAQSIAARSGGRPPSSGQALILQRRALAEILAG